MKTLKLTNPYGPNTTVLLPGSCNASCDFCFWDRDSSKIRPPEDYFERVFNGLAELHAHGFRTLSISGGEPTLSPYFRKFLSLLGPYRRKYPLDRVVLTTHGGNLLTNLTAVGCVVDHINISRHAVGTEANYKAFGTKFIPSDEQLQDLIQEVHNQDICDVTLNCVVPEDVTRKFCQSFLQYAQDLGADAVSFRKVASTPDPTKAEKWFRKHYGITGETHCPVCRGMEQQVDDFTVRWKGSVAEPSLTTKGVYEAVLHPDGKTYVDWGRKKLLKLPPRKPGNLILKPENFYLPQTPLRSLKVQEVPRPHYIVGGSGCGGGGCGAWANRSGCGSSSRCSV